jgi:glycosyltransferase involved in cell wall biosynthesis
VLLEALSFGVPVICLDHCGFSAVVTDACGIKIPVIKPSQFITDLARAIIRLYKDEALRRALSEGAVLRAKEFTWKEKIDVLLKIYEKTKNSC